MADTSIQITQGAGTNIDVANPGNGSTYRQVVALGDPNATVAAAIANVTNQALSVGATLYGTSPVTFPAGATITANQGGTWNANVSLQGTGAANVSIQGTVPVTGTVSLANNATVTAFQGASPWLVNASIVGSIPVTGIPGAGATVTAYQGNSPWGVNASIIGTPSVNANVQGTVPVSGTFWQATQPVSGTVTANFGANSTVTAYQGNAPWAANVSVQGQLPVTASIAGIVTVAGNFNVSSAPTITALQGNAPWSVVQGANSTITAFQGGNYTVTLAGNVSIGGISVSTAPTITALQGNAPWTVNASIQGIPSVNASIVGTVPVSGAFNVSLPGVTAVNVSLLGPTVVTLPGPVELWDGTNTANIVANDVGYNGQAINAATKVLSFGSGSTTGAQILLANTDVRGYSSVAVVANTVGSGLAWNGQFSPNSGGTYISSSSWTKRDVSSASPTALGTAANSMYVAPVSGAYFQLNVSALTSATLAGYVVLSSAPLTQTAVYAGQIGTWNVVASLANNATVTAFQGGNWTATLAGNVSIGSPNINNIGPGANIGNVVISLGANATLGMPVQPGPNATLTAYQGGSPWLVNASIIGAHNVSIAGNVTLGPVNVSLTGGVVLWPSPTLTGWTPYASAGLASIATISGVAGKFGGYMITNLNATPAYLQLFDVANGTAVSLGLSYNQLFAIPANSTAANGLAANLEITNGVKLSNGLKAAVTTGANATMVATGLVGTLWYV